MTLNKEVGWQFLVIWEFVVRPGKEQLFEQIYGPDGDWAQLFKKSCGYCGTNLTRDCHEPRRYLTFDFWESQDSYKKFKSQHAEEYKAIDVKCEALTETERELGKLIIPRTRD